MINSIPMTIEPVETFKTNVIHAVNSIRCGCHDLSNGKCAADAETAIDLMERNIQLLRQSFDEAKGYLK